MPHSKLLTMVFRISGLLTLAILLTPDPVQASCGSYVHWNGADQSHRPEAPCDGPECRSQKAPESPFSPPVSTSHRVSNDHWAIVDAKLPTRSPAAFRLEFDCPRIRSTYCLGGVFRPPRQLHA
jgi:hypothetical protein